MTFSGLCRVARKLVCNKSVYKIISSKLPNRNRHFISVVYSYQIKFLSIMPPKRKHETAVAKETKSKKTENEEYDEDDVEISKPTRTRAAKKELPLPTPSDSDSESEIKPKAKRAKNSKKTTKTKDAGNGDAKPSKGKKTKAQKADSDEEDTKPAKGRGMAKVHYEEVDDDDEEEDAVAKPARGRKNAKVEKSTAAPAKNKTSTNYDELDFDNCDKKTTEGKEWNFKISNWNVDGIRAWLKKGGLDYIEHEKPDVFCLQETKCSMDKLPSEVKEVDGYKVYWHCSDKDGYAGVALYSKTEPISVQYGVGHEEHDDEGRMITAEYEKFYVISVYVPNAGRGLVTLPKRLKWNDAFRNFVAQLDKKKPVIVCGDMNVAHLEIDLANPKTNTKNAGFTKEEREGMTDFLSDGYIDTFRELYPDKTQAYTFWTYMSNCRAKNVGWRLDYFIISKRFMNSVCDNVIRNEVFGSDHCPITLFINA